MSKRYLYSLNRFEVNLAQRRFTLNLGHIGYLLQDTDTMDVEYACPVSNLIHALEVGLPFAGNPKDSQVILRHLQFTTLPDHNFLLHFQVKDAMDVVTLRTMLHNRMSVGQIEFHLETL